MNKWTGIGRLTRDPDVRYSGEMAVAKYTLAVERRGKEKESDFISCVAFGVQGQFAEKYLKKGMKIAVSGRIQTGSYTNKEGQKVYTTDVVVEEHEFCEKKSDASEPPTKSAPDEGFMDIPDGIEGSLPFK